MYMCIVMVIYTKNGIEHNKIGPCGLFCPIMARNWEVLILNAGRYGHLSTELSVPNCSKAWIVQRYLWYWYYGYSKKVRLHSVAILPWLCIDDVKQYSLFQSWVNRNCIWADAIYNTLLCPVTQEFMNTSVYVPLDTIKWSFDTNLPWWTAFF